MEPITDIVFVPETIDYCCHHYIPPNKKYITCDEFPHTDGMDGSCWWCMEMTPYQWYMCQDESWIRSLLSPISRSGIKTREEAAAFIEQYKNKYPSKSTHSMLATCAGCAHEDDKPSHIACIGCARMYGDGYTQRERKEIEPSAPELSKCRGNDEKNEF